MKYEWAIFLYESIETKWNGCYWVGDSVTLVFTEEELTCQLKNDFISGKDRFGMMYKIPKLNISCIQLCGAAEVE